jgi:hypothetical protein
MIAVEDRPVVAKPLVTKPPMPREHGAWGILLIPFATAVGVTGVFDLKVALLLTSVLCFYIARTSYLRIVAALAKRGGLEGPRLTTAATAATRWLAMLLAGCMVCVVPLMFVWHLWWLAAFGAVVAPLAFRKTERSVTMQLLAVCGLTLTAPAAWYTATGHLGTPALLLWLLNMLYFAGGVFYVKMHVAAAMRRGGSKIRLGTPVLVYYTALLCVLLALASSGVISFWVSLAYAPVVLRAFVGVGRLGPTLRIKRLGWTEVAYSLVYAVVLVGAFRFG